MNAISRLMKAIEGFFAVRSGFAFFAHCRVSRFNEILDALEITQALNVEIDWPIFLSQCSRHTKAEVVERLILFWNKFVFDWNTDKATCFFWIGTRDSNPIVSLHEIYLEASAVDTNVRQKIIWKPMSKSLRLRRHLVVQAWYRHRLSNYLYGHTVITVMRTSNDEYRASRKIDLRGPGFRPYHDGGTVLTADGCYKGIDAPYDLDDFMHLWRGSDMFDIEGQLRAAHERARHSR